MFLFDDVPNKLACPEVENLGQSGASSPGVMSGKQTRGEQPFLAKEHQRAGVFEGNCRFRTESFVSVYQT
jgi:hypothetical protein